MDLLYQYWTTNYMRRDLSVNKDKLKKLLNFLGIGPRHSSKFIKLSRHRWYKIHAMALRNIGVNHHHRFLRSFYVNLVNYVPSTSQYMSGPLVYLCMCVIIGDLKST